MRVLIIGNDITYRKGISIAASHKKWVPIPCGSLKEAKEIICSKPPDLIISDCLLYDETVIDLLQWMRLKSIEIPVIAVSASDDEALSEEVIQQGVNCFYDKFDFNLSKIYEILEKWQV